MPTTDFTTKEIGIVSPSPHITRTRSFTMPDFTPIVEYAFSFAANHQSPALEDSLNNTYSEPLDDAAILPIFTDVQHTVVDTDAIAKIRVAIIDSITACSQADRTTIAPIVNSLLLFVMVGKPLRRYPLRSHATLTTALTAVLTNKQVNIVIFLNRTTLFVAPTILSLSKGLAMFLRLLLRLLLLHQVFLI